MPENTSDATCATAAVTFLTFSQGSQRLKRLFLGVLNGVDFLREPANVLFNVCSFCCAGSQPKQ